MKKLFVILLCFAPVGLFAQAFQLNLQGTRQIGKGSTGMAQPTDATAVFYNPASMVFLEGNDVTLGVTPAITKGQFTLAGTNRISHTDNQVQTPFNLSATFGNSESDWRFGISVYTPFGLTNKWEEGSATRFETTKMSLLSISFQPTAAYKISDKLGIGVGLIYTYGQVDMERDLPVQYMDGSYGSAAIKGSAYGFGVNAGVYYKPSDKVSLALTYRSGITMKADDGDAEFMVPASLRGNFPSQSFKAELPLPDIYGIGISYSPSEEWVVNGEVYLSDWHDYDEIVIHYKEAPVNGENNTTLVRHYGNGYSFRGGVEYLPEGKKYEIRAGFLYNLSPVPDDLVSPDVPDADRISPAVGFSYNFSDKFRADFAFLYEFVHREGKNRITGMNGTYNFDLFFPSIGITYNY